MFTLGTCPDNYPYTASEETARYNRPYDEYGYQIIASSDESSDGEGWLDQISGKPSDCVGNREMMLPGLIQTNDSVTNDGTSDEGEYPDFAGFLTRNSWKQPRQAQDRARERDRAGFIFRGVVQFFDREEATVGGPRPHSTVCPIWDADGSLAFIVGDDPTSEFILGTSFGGGVLWDREKAKRQSCYYANRAADCASEESSEESSDTSNPLCGRITWPLPPFNTETGLFESDEQHDAEESSDLQETGGCVFHCMTIRGVYGHQCTVESSDVADSSDVEPVDEPLLTERVIYKPGYFACIDEFADDIPPGVILRSTSTEQALHFDVSGRLCRYFLGGINRGDLSRLVWDRERDKIDPLTGLPTAGVIVSFLQHINSTDHDPNNFRIWLVHFDCDGNYLKCCHFASLCGCPVVVDSDDDFDICHCPPYLCFESGPCNAMHPGVCPPSIILLCGDEGIGRSCPDYSDKPCTYTPVGGEPDVEVPPCDGIPCSDGTGPLYTTTIHGVSHPSLPDETHCYECFLDDCTVL